MARFLCMLSNLIHPGARFSVCLYRIYGNQAHACIKAYFLRRCASHADAVAGNTYFHQNAKFDGETEEAESGVSGTTIVIVLLVVSLLVAGGVTAFAYQKKILCFEDSSGAGDEEEATGDESPLLKDATSASQLSPSRATSASGTTLNKSRPSGTTAY